MEAEHVWHIDYMQLNLNMALKLIRVLRRFYISSGFRSAKHQTCSRAPMISDLGEGVGEGVEKQSCE